MHLVNLNFKINPNMTIFCKAKHAFYPIFSLNLKLNALSFHTPVSHVWLPESFCEGCFQTRCGLIEDDVKAPTMSFYLPCINLQRCIHYQRYTYDGFVMLWCEYHVLYLDEYSKRSHNFFLKFGWPQLFYACVKRSKWSMFLYLE